MFAGSQNPPFTSFGCATPPLSVVRNVNNRHALPRCAAMQVDCAQPTNFNAPVTCSLCLKLQMVLSIVCHCTTGSLNCQVRSADSEMEALQRHTSRTKQACHECSPIRMYKTLPPLCVSTAPRCL